MMRTSKRLELLVELGHHGLGDLAAHLVRGEQPREIDDVEQRRVARDRRQRDAAEIDLPGAQHAQQFRPVEVALRPARERHRDAAADALGQFLAQHRDVDAGVLRDGRRELRHHLDRDRRSGRQFLRERGA